MERRKIVYQDGSYQLLKPNGDGRFFPWGERKSLKALADAYRKKEFNLIMPRETEALIKEYIRKEEERMRDYITKNSLESKTI